MCFMGTGGTAPKSDPVSVTVPTTAGATTKIDDDPVADNTLTKGAINNGVIPAEELNQSAPRKKTENLPLANSLAIGTKRYRTSKNVGVGAGAGGASTGLAGVK